ncbi:MAG: queuosine precursor transporter [Candidatus Aenigmatarchaeota archaeon]
MDKSDDNHEKRERKILILSSIFIAALITANLLGGKLINILGITVSVGIFMYPITFVVTDILEEVEGKKRVKGLVYAGFIALVFTLFFVYISRLIPPDPVYLNNEMYLEVFNNSMRVIIASIVAFSISQLHDIWAFNKWKKKTKGKYLWLRNNASTIVSQLIDSTIFMFIAFYMVNPNLTTFKIIEMIIPYWLLKVSIAFIDTPFVYAGVKWLRRK